jgi:large subunit ribosomal protein L15
MARVSSRFCNGELKAKLEVEAHAFSKSAEEAIKAVGGNATKI